jgi:hypothetical protein
MVITAINVSFVRMAKKPPLGRPALKHSMARMCRFTSSETPG